VGTKLAHPTRLHIVNEKEIKELFDRLGRLVNSTAQKTGDTFAWQYTFENGETHQYIVHGLKSPKEIEDSVCNLLIWMWNVKDYLKHRAKSVGKNPQHVEDAVDEDKYLPVCADLANRLKHGSLNRSRSNLYPHLEEVRFEIPQSALKSLTILAFEVVIQVAEPNLVQFSQPVLDHSGEPIGDVFDYIKNGIATLEKIRDEIECIE